MRYNPGGSVNSSRLLASMVYSTNTAELYIKQRWNAKWQAQFTDEELKDFFADKTKNGTALNTLNLSKVYVLATRNSASASELVMNGLDPYINVFHIGTTTRGKNEFSITMVDDVDNSFIYNPDRVNNINPNNQWGLQPLVGRNENADGFSNYTDGLVPDVEFLEDLQNLGVLGDESEPLLGRAIQEITGAASKSAMNEIISPISELTNSKFHSGIKDNMILDKKINLN